MHRLAKYFWDMYDHFKKADQKYDFPFPMAVFGTLRKLPSPSFNSYLMGKHKKDHTNYGDIDYFCHCKAFIEHIVPVGLSLSFKEGASGVLEVYFYNKNNWNNAISDIDSLEGFSPSYKREYGYIRTLVRVRLLPKDFESSFYQEKFSFPEFRDLGLDQNTWNECIEIPAWIYSNKNTNLACKKFSKSPILWDGR